MADPVRAVAAALRGESQAAGPTAAAALRALDATERPDVLEAVEELLLTRPLRRSTGNHGDDPDWEVDPAVPTALVGCWRRSGLVGARAAGLVDAVLDAHAASGHDLDGAGRDAPDRGAGALLRAVAPSLGPDLVDELRRRRPGANARTRRELVALAVAAREAAVPAVLDVLEDPHEAEEVRMAAARALRPWSWAGAVAERVHSLLRAADHRALAALEALHWFRAAGHAEDRPVDVAGGLPLLAGLLGEIGGGAVEDAVRDRAAQLVVLGGRHLDGLEAALAPDRVPSWPGPIVAWAPSGSGAHRGGPRISSGSWTRAASAGTRRSCSPGGSDHRPRARAVLAARIREELASDDPRMAASAAWALSRLGDRGAIPALTRAASRPRDDPYRVAAALARARLGDAGVADELQHLAVDPFAPAAVGTWLRTLRSLDDEG